MDFIFKGSKTNANPAPQDSKLVLEKPDELPKPTPANEKVAGHTKGDDEDSLDKDFDEIIRMIIETKYVSIS